MDVPHRHDIGKISCVNKGMDVYNRKLWKQMKVFDNVEVVNAYLERSFSQNMVNIWIEKENNWW